MLKTYIEGNFGVILTKKHFVLIIDGKMYGKLPRTREVYEKLMIRLEEVDRSEGKEFKR